MSEFREENMVRPVNSEYGMQGAYSSSRYLYHAIKAEGMPECRQWGIIVFPVNDSESAEAINDKEEKIRAFLETECDSAWSTGNYMSGRYTDRCGNVYDKNSLSVSLPCMETEALKTLAERLCHEALTGPLLIKDHAARSLYSADAEKEEIR